MTLEHEKIIKEIMDNMPDSFWGRLWDDNCICEDGRSVNPKCTNKRCIEWKNENQKLKELK